MALRSVPWNFVISSDLLRTRRTLDIIQEMRPQPLEDDIQVIFNPVLREVNFGVREGLQKDISVEEAKRIRSEEKGVSLESVTDSCESEAEVMTRQRAFLDELRALIQAPQAHLGTNIAPMKVLCVTHGGFIRRFLANFTNNLNKIDSVANCSITIVHVSYSQDSDGSPICTALDVCETSHLRDITGASATATADIVGGGAATSTSIAVEEYLWPS
jgi:broad specificity phosphatase PhoE